MATSFLSPGVYVREIDFSLYVPNLSTTAVGCVGYATKGPINQPQYISNPAQFSSVFGDPSPDMMGPYAALQFLSMGRQLWYVRVAETNDDPNATHAYLSAPAEVTLKEVATKAKIVGTKTNVVTITAANDALTFSVDGTASTLLFEWDPGTGSLVKSISDIANDLNKNANFAAYFTATLSSTGALAIERNIAGSDHGFSIAGTGLTNIFGTGFDPNTPPVAWGTGTISEKAYVIGNKVFPATVNVPSGDTLTFIVDGVVKTVTFPTVVLPDTYTTYTQEGLLDFLNSSATFTNNNLVASFVSGALFVTYTSNSTKTLLMLGGDGQTGDCGQLLFGNVNAAKYIFGNSAPAAITSTTNLLTFKIVDGTVGATFNTYTEYTLTLTPGTYDAASLNGELQAQLQYADDGVTAGGVDLRSFFEFAVVDTTHVSMTYTGSQEYVVYDVTSSAFSKVFGQHPLQKYASTSANDVLTVTATSDGTWGNRLAVAVSNVDVVNGTFTLTVFERGYVVERYDKLVKTPEVLGDGSANPYFIENAINGVSTRITVANDTAAGPTLLPSANATGSATALTGGDDGVADIINPSTFIGVNDEINPTGLQLFRNPEQIDINLVMVPGIASAPVINAMIDICIFRHDCMALVDPPYGLTPQSVVDWANGAGVYSGEHAVFNTSYAALYWPWLQIYDPVNKSTVWTPPSGHLSYIYAYTDYNSETWFAPAGLNRGHLSTPIKAEYIPTLGERDLLYTNNVNPIATFIRDGINVWGQKTLQRNPTALDRVNVRRLMLYLEKVVATAVRTLVFEPSDKITWIQFINLVEPFLESVKSRRGLLEYKVICDETTNTSDAIDRNEMRARIYIRPTKAAEFISIDFVLTDSGTAFSELVY